MMISVVSQYVIGFTCHNESMLIGQTDKGNLPTDKANLPTNGSGCSFQQTFVGQDP